MIPIVRPSAALLLGAAIVTLAGCHTIAPTTAPPPPPPTKDLFSDCNHIPVGTYSDTSGTLTLQISESPTNPGFKHNTRINLRDYIAMCEGQNSSVMDVQPKLNPGTTVTKWTVTDAGSGKIHVVDMGSGSGDPTLGFNGTLSP